MSQDEHPKKISEGPKRESRLIESQHLLQLYRILTIGYNYLL